MLKTILSPLTTAAPAGVAMRDIWQVVMTVISLAGILGVLSGEQVEALKRLVTDLAGQWPAIVAAFGAVSVIGMTVYRIFTKSMSDRTAEVARKIEANVPPSVPIVAVEAITPAGEPNIQVAVK